MESRLRVLAVTETAEIALEGELDETTLELLVHLLAPILSRDKQIVLDLSQVTAMDAVAARALIFVSRTTEHPVVIRKASDGLVRVLTGVSDPASGAWIDEGSLSRAGC